VPVGTLEEVDEIDPQRVFGLAGLPVLAGRVAFQVLTESAYLIRQGLVRRRACQTAAHPADAMWRGLFLYQLRLQDEFAELLQRRFQFPHGSPRVVETSLMPSERRDENPYSGRKLCVRLVRRATGDARLVAAGSNWRLHPCPEIGAFRLFSEFRALARRRPSITDHSVGCAKLVSRKNLIGYLRLRQDRAVVEWLTGIGR
jgi:hypothetical protein